MIMDTIKKLFAQKLMDIKAIKLQPSEPFTWASGWKSPIYTDNRKTLGFADVRSFVKLELCHAIQQYSLRLKLWPAWLQVLSHRVLWWLTS